MRPWIRSSSNIFPKRPLRDAFLAQNAIVSAQKAPAGRFLAQNTILSTKKAPVGQLSDLRNVKKHVSWYLFRLCYMQSEAFRIVRQVRITGSCVHYWSFL